MTGIVSISPDEFEAMPPTFDGDWLREQFPDVAQSMDRFIDKIKAETHGELVGELEIIRIPLDLYRARNTTSRRVARVRARPSVGQRAGLPARRLRDRVALLPVDLAGLECAFVPGRLIANRTCRCTTCRSLRGYVYQQWLRVYMRSQMIKHNKDLLECVDDTEGLLEKLHVY